MSPNKPLIQSINRREPRLPVLQYGIITQTRECWSSRHLISSPLRALEDATDHLCRSGFRPIATCSPSNAELVRRFGAEQTFDYHSATCGADIRAYTRNQLSHALDCIAEAETTQLCYAAIGRAGGRYVAVEPFRRTVAESRAETIEPSWFNVMTIWGRKVELGGDYSRDASPEDRTFGTRAFAAVQTLLDRGEVSTHPVKVMPGGLDGVAHGLATIRSKPPSGYKLVYKIS